MTNNLLIALHRWAHRQDENFVTDAFAHLLRTLLDENPPAALSILEKLTDGRFPSSEFEPGRIQVHTQVTGARGRPDVRIVSPNHHVLIEVKVESELGDRQLERYLEDLREGRLESHTTMVLLSRYLVELSPAMQEKVISKRWYEVAHLIDELILQQRLTQSVSAYVARQFVSFLEFRGMTVDRIGPELVTGLAALADLLVHLQNWAASRGQTSQISMGTEWAGIYTPKGSQEYFIGIYYNRSDCLLFATEFQIDEKRAESLDFGRVARASWVPGKLQWQNELALGVGEEPFFNMSRNQQVQCLEQFLDDSIRTAATLRVASPKSSPKNPGVLEERT